MSVCVVHKTQFHLWKSVQRNSCSHWVISAPTRYIKWPSAQWQRYTLLGASRKPLLGVKWAASVFRLTARPLSILSFSATNYPSNYMFVYICAGGLNRYSQWKCFVCCKGTYIHTVCCAAQWKFKFPAWRLGLCWPLTCALRREFVH